MSLRDAVNQSLETYFEQMDEQEPSDLYSMVMNEVEKPLSATSWNKQTRTNAAQQPCLG